MNTRPLSPQSFPETVFLGFDIGSVSLNTVIMNSEDEVIAEYYDFIHGKPYETLLARLRQILPQVETSRVEGVAFTGNGGRIAAEHVGGSFVNEIIAQATAAGMLYPEVRTVIEIGGEDSKLIMLEKDPLSAHSRLVDFEMNSVCAAGTGSFLDQQARRMGISIEREFGELALRSAKPPRIAGRCSVFAKSDMIHLQQMATPLHDIVAGLCFALARNFKSNVARRHEIRKPVIFSGGVAANAGMVKALLEIFSLQEHELIIPDYHASMGAIGALLYARAHIRSYGSFKGIKGLEHYVQSSRNISASLPRLADSGKTYNKSVHRPVNGEREIPVYLGIDVGSLSTNVVLIDDRHRVVARRYLPTASKPLEAIQRGMSEIFDEVGSRVVVMAAGTTGSGRYLTGDFIGADVIRNEITAQATAAVDYDPTVDTIFEIGGQDSKYISLANGVVVDFEMNKVCAAGTGSFLEEQAEKLNINIIEEFGKLALDSPGPVKLGDRCTVFMESDLNAHMQKGCQNRDLVGGLAYSIVMNYLEKVVGDRKIGNHIFFQGGVTNNKAVVAAFEQVTGKKITVPPHFDVTGAIGAAILAKQGLANGQKTRFKGFDIRSAEYTLSSFTCKECVNNCEIRQVNIQGEKKPLFYGGRCEKYEKEDRKTRNDTIPDLFRKRTELLLEGYRESNPEGRTTIGIPRSLMLFYQQFPFWRTFFEELGFAVMISRETDKKLVTRSLESIVSETCLPVEIAHGHVEDLAERGADYIFIPFVVNAKAKPGNPTVNYNCPWVQSYPFMVRAAFRGKIPDENLLMPALHFRYLKGALLKELSVFMFDKFGIARDKVEEAVLKADRVQVGFEARLTDYGREVLRNVPPGVRPVILFGRPYNGSDAYLNLGLINKLISQNVLPIPLDFLDLSGEDIFTDYRSMCWPNGQKILAAARIVAKNPNLSAVYISNFRCGPDSFLSHFVAEEMKGKPYLQLEIDEHTADAGMITRIEAFLDSLQGYEKQAHREEKVFRPRLSKPYPAKNRILYFPYMNDGGIAIAAAARRCGIESQVLPPQDLHDMELGRKYTSSKECFPMICTTGSFLRKLMEPATDPSKVCFFMPDHNGPCRFGMYNHFQRIIFDKLGYQEAEIVAPSNNSSYEDISGGHGTTFRFNAWRGFLAIDYLRKLKQEILPYELMKGDTEKTYRKALDDIARCIESGKGSLHGLLKELTGNFKEIPVDKTFRKPVVTVIGEIFMRDNPFCSGYLVQKLEALGVETLIAPFSEWVEYSTYRYTRDSIWKNSLKGYLKSKLQKVTQEISAAVLLNDLKEYIDHEKEVPLHEMLTLCGPYVHKDYDGDPPIALGTVAHQVHHGISGVANILPFTCMPGTIISSVSDMLRKEHGNIPWINIAYDGQDTGQLDTRLQAFVFQVKEFSRATDSVRIRVHA